MQQRKGFGDTAAKMDLTIKGWNGVKDTVELGEDDTPAVMRRKVASAVGLPEDGFAMSFGGVAMDEGYDMTQLSAGDTVVLTEAKVTKYEARAALHALGETDITAKRLESVEDPEVVRLLLQAEVATVIPDVCLLLQAEVATVVPDLFLWKASLTNLDLSAESVVTQIGFSFLHSCTSLTSIDLSGLIHVTEIEYCFLAGCSALCNLDLTPLSRVTRVGFAFLKGCTSLCTLDLTPLSSVIKIESSFLSGCSSLSTLDLTPLSRVAQVEKGFLFGCSSLRTLDLTPLRRVTKIESGFLSRCSSLSTLDLTPLSSVTEIGYSFLYGCSSLRSLNFSPLSRVTQIDHTFLGCTSLRSIYLTGCSDVVSRIVRDELRELVVESRPKRSRDEPLEESRKRLRHAE